MTDAVVENGIHDLLIREAFIDPIRTLIVVDDEYPTLDSLTDKESGVMTNWSDKKRENITNVREFLAFARDKERSWLIDVHDATDVTPDAATYLHHSDLLVLDYHLQGDEGGGDVAIGILRELADDNHFNLVIVHTKGDDGNIDQVVREIALGLTCAEPFLTISDEESTAIRDAISLWEDDDDQILSKLEAEILEDTYLECRSKYPGKPDALLSLLQPGESIRDIWKGKPKSIDIKLKQVAQWLLIKKHDALKIHFSPKMLGNVMVGNSGKVNWIKTEKLFITVLSKECKPNDFETKIIAAIKASFLSPHRLLLTKMRAEIENRGLSVEAEILGDRFMQAEWLNEFLKPDPVDTKAVIHNTINRHWEALGDRLRLTLDVYANGLLEYFSALGRDTVLTRCGINNSDIGSQEALKRFNCFSSTKPIDRSHLTTGHVFRMDNGVGGEHQYWICLSPACDMVPEPRNAFPETDSLPFIAVRLYHIEDKQALTHATKNIFLFLEIQETVHAYSIHKDGNATHNPEWEQMFVENLGKFQNENKLSLGSIKIIDKNLSLSWSEASVVTQLRSEYALYLLQRIGTFLSRPGLGMNFKQLSK
jgi:hypothetical protein